MTVVYLLFLIIFTFIALAAIILFKRSEKERYYRLKFKNKSFGVNLLSILIPILLSAMLIYTAFCYHDYIDLHVEPCIDESESVYLTLSAYHVYVSPRDKRLDTIPIRDIDDFKIKVFENDRAIKWQKLPHKSVTLIFVMDASGSMWGSINQAKEAAKLLADYLPADTTAGLVRFDDSVEVLYVGKDRIELSRQIDTFSAGGCTALYAAIGEGIEILNKTCDDTCNCTHSAILVVLTDGCNNCPPNSPEGIIATARATEVQIITVGLGSFVNRQVLWKIANDTGGKYYYAPAADELGHVYRKIYEEHIGGTTIFYPKTKIPAKVRVEFEYKEIRGENETVIDRSSWR